MRQCNVRLSSCSYSVYPTMKIFEMLKLKMLDTRNVEETKEPIDAPDRTGTWLRQLPSLPASTAYIHYPPYPYPKVPCSGPGWCTAGKRRSGDGSPRTILPARGRERVEAGHTDRRGDEGTDRLLGSNQRMAKTNPLATSFHLIYT